jgi:RimJ/RimL family protein N-acetyltransferase
MTEPTLTDGVVVLDLHTLADVEAHHAGEDEEQARWFGRYPKRSSREQVRAAVERWRESWRTGGPTRAFAVRDAASGTLVGGCEVRLREDGVASLSWWVFPPHRRRGFASRAVRLACDHAFAYWGVERAEAEVDARNVASRATARRAGFTEEGTLRAYWGPDSESSGRRDVVMYSMLPSDATSVTRSPGDVEPGRAHRRPRPR